jgi:hypothetical protein
MTNIQETTSARCVSSSVVHQDRIQNGDQVCPMSEALMIQGIIQVPQDSKIASYRLYVLMHDLTLLLRVLSSREELSDLPSPTLLATSRTLKSMGILANTDL